MSFPIDESTFPSRKVYGRGFFDGLKAAGITDTEGFMNVAKINATVNQLSGIAKKVYDHCPSDSAITGSKLCADLKNLGSRPDIRVVEGCLNTLVEQGLVRETQRGHFVRIEIKQPKPQMQVVKQEDKPKSPLQKPVDPVEQLDLIRDMAECASSIRKLADMAEKVAKQVEDVALDVEMKVQASQSDAAKLRQLQSILKSLGA